MRVLVTGAAGYVGRAVVHRLSTAGHQVVALVHSDPRAALPVPARVADLLDPASLAGLGRVDAVCHLAARTRVRESFSEPTSYFQANVTGTLNLLEMLAGEASEPPAFVLASTGAVYGVPDQQPIPETVPPVPLTPYGASKLAAEHAVRWQASTGALGAVILRTFNVAGAVDGHPDPDQSRIIPKTLAVCAGLADRLDVNGDGSAVREYLHVDDLARAFVRAVDAAKPGQASVYNAGAGVGTTVREIIDTAEQLTGKAVTVHWGPPKPEPAVMLADTASIREELGWKPERSDLVSILSDAWAALDH